METKYINNQNWQNFLLNQIEKYDIFSLFVADENNYNYSKLSSKNLNETVIGKYRAQVPIKTFFFPPVEKIIPAAEKKPKIIIGIKACELVHLRLFDSIFLGGEYRDTVYEEARKNTIIISADCTSAKECCFCSVIDGQPYATSGFDINLRPVGNGFVVEILSEKGKELVKKNEHLFQDIVQNYIIESERNRRSVNEQVIRINIKKNINFTKRLNKAVNSVNPEFWNEVSKECVECGGCRFVCSSCYCFLLGELPDFEKYRLWDACQFKGYARVAGGANPKPTKEKRYKNLYSCKFDYRYTNFGFYACSGCGRCIEVCPAEIDIREVITQISADEVRR
ncbi:MAG: 4Fe-4S dicluster domain-containing protein [Elusimicrobiota bacterium]